MPQTLSKKERLSSKKDIGILMKSGRWGVCGGLKYCYLIGNGTGSAAMDGAAGAGEVAGAAGATRADGAALGGSAGADGATRADGAGGQESPVLNRIMVSVPKKFFKRAVKRNLLKRRLRESYRRQKDLLKGVGGGVDIMFQYNTSEVLSYEYLHALVGKILEGIAANN